MTRSSANTLASGCFGWTKRLERAIAAGKENPAAAMNAEGDVTTLRRELETVLARLERPNKPLH